MSEHKKPEKPITIPELEQGEDAAKELHALLMKQHALFKDGGRGFQDKAMAEELCLYAEKHDYSFDFSPPSPGVEGSTYYSLVAKHASKQGPSSYLAIYSAEELTFPSIIQERLQSRAQELEDMKKRIEREIQHVMDVRSNYLSELIDQINIELVKLVTPGEQRRIRANHAIYKFLVPEEEIAEKVNGEILGKVRFERQQILEKACAKFKKILSNGFDKDKVFWRAMRPIYNHIINREKITEDAITPMLAECKMELTVVQKVIQSAREELSLSIPKQEPPKPPYRESGK